METTRRIALGAALCGGALLSQSWAAAQTRPFYTVPFSAVIPLTSRINGVHYLLYVRQPPVYDANPVARFPLIVTLDADYSFALCANHLEHLSFRMNQAPQAILLSIAVAGVYPDLDRYHLERTRDYTPIYSADGGNANTPFQHVSGGGPAFQRVIAEEILPLIDGQYRTDPNERTLVGHSFGGLFACWTLHTRPDLFNRFIAVSPSLWYADKWLFDREAEQASTRLMRRTRIYFAVGSLEEQPANQAFMVSQVEAFSSLLAARRDPNLLVDHRVFEDETHASIFPAAFSTGIRHLFASEG